MTAHICAWCKCGLGDSPEERLHNEVEAMLMPQDVSHGICEECQRHFHSSQGPVTLRLRKELQKKGYFDAQEDANG